MLRPNINCSERLLWSASVPGASQHLPAARPRARATVPTAEGGAQFTRYPPGQKVGVHKDTILRKFPTEAIRAS
eukprot:gene15403-biopygen11229